MSEEKKPSSVTTTVDQKQLAEWDAELSKRPCDYVKLEKELIEALAKHKDDTEILWRLVQVCYFRLMDLMDEDELRTKTQEAFKYGERAVQICEEQKREDFNVSKWMACLAGRQALLAVDINEKAKYIVNHIKHINQCLRFNPDDQFVLFMQGRFQLAVSLLCEDEMKALKDISPDVPLYLNNLGDAEIKLKKAIELDPNHLDSYITLAYMLVKSHKLDEANVIIEKALKVETCSKSEEMIRKELLKIKEALVA